MLRTTWKGQTLELLPQRAMYWVEERLLVIADPHFGEGSSLRTKDIPIPIGSTKSDLTRLTMLLDFLDPVGLLVLGEFFHAKESQSDETLDELQFWRHRFPRLEVALIPGDQDIQAGPPPEDFGITIINGGYKRGPLLFRHEPVANEDPETYTFSGDIHPAVKLRASDGSKIKAPCFLFGERVGLLPAFGSMTGTKVMSPKQSDRIFLLGPSEVVEIPVNQGSMEL